MTKHKNEAQLEALFRERVISLGGLAFKLAPTHVGIPDRLVILPFGIVEFVELKTDTGSLRPAQAEWIRQAELRSATVSVLYGQTEIEAWTASRRATIDRLSRQMFEESEVIVAATEPKPLIGRHTHDYRDGRTCLVCGKDKYKRSTK